MDRSGHRVSGVAHEKQSRGGTARHATAGLTCSSMHYYTHYRRQIRALSYALLLITQRMHYLLKSMHYTMHLSSVKGCGAHGRAAGDRPSPHTHSGRRGPQKSATAPLPGASPQRALADSPECSHLLSCKGLQTDPPNGLQMDSMALFVWLRTTPLQRGLRSQGNCVRKRVRAQQRSERWDPNYERMRAAGGLRARNHALLGSRGIRDEIRLGTLH